jgi:hypothetical protein
MKVYTPYQARYFEMYVAASNDEVRNHALKQRLKQFCKRALRKQVSKAEHIMTIAFEIA